MPVGQQSIGQQPNGGYDRFRSFAERYLIARAHDFTKGKELEDGWEAIQVAKKLYRMAADASREAEAADTSSEIDNQMQRAALHNMAQLKAKAQQAMSPIQSVPPIGPYVMPLNPYPDEAKQIAETITELSKQGITPPKGLIRQLYKLMRGTSNAKTP